MLRRVFTRSLALRPHTLGSASPRFTRAWPSQSRRFYMASTEDSADIASFSARSQDNELSPEQRAGETSVVVKSVFVAPKLSMTRFVQEVYSKVPCVQLQSRSIVVTLGPNPPNLGPLGTDVVNVAKHPKHQDSFVNAESALASFDPKAAYAVIFPYGSIVFVNATEEQQAECIKQALRYTPKPNRSVDGASVVLNEQGQARASTDDYRILIRPDAPQLWNFVPDCVLVKELDLKSLCLVSQVLGQTIAMEYYERKVEGLIDKFRSLNLGFEAKGRLVVSVKEVIKLVAHNNLIMADVLTHLKLLDRSEIAWKQGRYYSLWEGLRDEFEVQERFDALELKLQLTRDNATFFFEVVDSKKTKKLEWIIIILISFEVVISLYNIYEREKEKEKGDAGKLVASYH